MVYSTDEHKNLCFRHAVELANKGVNIEQEIRDSDSYYSYSQGKCELCDKEKKG